MKAKKNKMSQVHLIKVHDIFVDANINQLLKYSFTELQTILN